MNGNPLPAGTQEAWQWDEQQVVIDTIRAQYPLPAPTNPPTEQPDPLDAVPGVQRRYNEARAIQITLETNYIESQDAEKLEALDQAINAWRRNNPRPVSEELPADG